MTTTLDAVLLSWPVNLWVIVPLLLTAAIYLRGWLALRRRGARRWGPAQLTAFLGGLLAVFLALNSPLDAFASLLLQVHMVQHLLLMMVAPPLLWLGLPLVPLLRGLPRSVRRDGLGPFLHSRGISHFFERITHPVPALLLYVVATWLWHVPYFYEKALRSPGWHHFEHACFLVAALIFWWLVVRPYPARPAWSRWLLLPYLLLADVQNTVLSAILTFSDRVLYPWYEAVPRLGGLSALDDQAAAGVLMWVPGSVAFLLPLAVIGVGLLLSPLSPVLGGEGPGVRGRDSGRGRPPHPQPLSPGTPGERGVRARGRLSLPLVAAPPPLDVLRAPLLGRFLKWRHARFTLQLPLLLLAGVVIWDGLCGPQVGPLNLAGVLPWIHWRGLLIIGLLAAGNVFCMGCPFLLPRTLARRWLPAGRAWPRWLRNKWPAIALLLLFLWSYEAFSLWDRPALTAIVALTYFAAAFVVDSLFRGASFCKYVCPIGQFNFVGSLLSPVEVKMRDPAVCATCETRDCIRGNDKAPGCELHLYQPRKAGNLDCTFCLDCVHACPHDNVGLLPVVPGAALHGDPQRSGIGRFGRRPDLAALVLLLVFGAFANAAGMVGPVVQWQEQMRDASGLRSALAPTTLFYVASLLVLPVLAVGAATALSHRHGGRLALAIRYSYALIPLGFAMWAAHYSFHFLTSWSAAVPAAQRCAADAGLILGDSIPWARACCAPVADWVLQLEIVFLGLGLLLSLYAAYRIALHRHPRMSQALREFLPWAVLLLLLFVAGIWIVFQPMEMRGTLGMPG